MRVNIEVSFEVVEDAFAGEHSVDLADLEASGMGPHEAAGAVVATVQDDARKARSKAAGARKERPAAAASAGGDYPLDPDQD
jgi:hypothetical protein